MKKINKATLVAALESVRAYYGVDDIESPEAAQKLTKMHRACMDVDKAAKLGRMTALDFCMSILRPFGLKDTASDEDIFKALEVLGWKVE